MTHVKALQYRILCLVSLYFARCEIRSTRPIGRLGTFLSIPASNLYFTKHRTGHRHTDSRPGALEQ